MKTFTRKLNRINEHLFHPSSEMLFNFLRQGHPSELKSETRRIVQDITKRCDPCQRSKSAPKRLRVSFGAEEAGFNGRIMIDIMQTDGRALLHVVYESAKFSTARFLDDGSTKAISTKITECGQHSQALWTSIYTALIEWILVDQRKNLGADFVRTAAFHDVNVEGNGIESHNSV